MTTLYFAYGSNMLSSRLIKRVSSAKTVGRAALYNYCVKVSKKSENGSGKANLFHLPGFVTWGILYEISIDDLGKLDKIEKGYNRITVKVKKEDDEIAEAETYISDDLIDNSVAFDSYKKILISGAIEHNLPQDYVQFLQQLPSKPEKAG